jgi:phenylacetate-CoA ligase
MAVLTTAAAFVRLERTQWLNRPRLVELQAVKLRRLVDHAYHRVPFYRAHFDQAGVRPGDIRTPADLRALPPVTKDDLRRAEPEATLSTAFARESLSADRTSGSTATPFTVMRTRQFQAVRKAQVLRLLRSAGYRVGDRVLSLVRAKKPPPAWWSHWRYQSIDAPPEELLRAIDVFRPALITGYTTSLRQLARLIEEGGKISNQPRVLLNSGELLDDASRHLVSGAFGAPVLDAYAMTEMGVVAWECAPYNYHVSEDTLVIEPELVAGTGEARLILTNLELESMPFIRYASGDLVTVADSPEACACGRKLLRLRRIDGRLLDTVVLPDGRMISPFRFTSLLQELPVRRYQLVQQDLNRFRLRLSPARPDDALADQARTMIRHIAGADAEVDVAWEDDLDPPPAIKFRAVESRIGRSASGTYYPA